MAKKIFWKVDDQVMPCPSTWVWGLQDVSLGESGRTDDALMHKNRVAQKRKIQVGYNGITDENAHIVLASINPEYIQVNYYDLLDGKRETRTFYVGDRSAPFKWWFDGKHIIESLTFNLIER
jgi:hypothetical protein